MPRFVPGLARALRRALPAIFLVAIVAAHAPGCSPDEGEATCTGLSTSEGCLAKCDVTKCATGHACVANDCRPTCSTQAECPAGYNCVGVYVDEALVGGVAVRENPDGTPLTGTHCFQLPYAASGSTGQGTACDPAKPEEEQCDTLRGYRCVEGTCQLPCWSHADCGAAGHCEIATAGARGHCVGDDAPRGAGQYGTACPELEGCDTASGFECAGGAATDPDNYCTLATCSADTDCALGYACVAAPAREGAGSIGGENRCEKRDYCRPCETQGDCAGYPGQVCARDSGGAKICTVVCDPNLENACPWGTASLCGVTDTELGVATCSHKAGACVGDGGACTPCGADGDCGANGLCLTLSGTLERVCVDLDHRCTTDQECPYSPGGPLLQCASAAVGTPTTSPLFERCLPPNIAPNPIYGTKFGCWM
ncbi:MAG: hypothetical protein IT376_05955 [Polyangiaceae bacterium]|nr:hypothetical protein [Polyangiaceae bacterium]